MGDSSEVGSSSGEETDSKPKASLQAMESPPQPKETLERNRMTGQKRTAEGPRSLIKKRYRSGIPPARHPQSGQSSSKLFNSAAVTIAPAAAAKKPERIHTGTSAISEDSARDPSASLLGIQPPVGTFPSIPSLAGSTFAQYPIGWQQLAMQATPVGPRGRTMPETLYPVGLSAQEFLLQDQMRRNRYAMLMAQLAATDAPPIDQMQPMTTRQNDLLRRFLSFPSTAQGENWGNSSRFGGSGIGNLASEALVDQYRRQLLPQQLHQQLQQTQRHSMIDDNLEHRRPPPPPQERRPVELSRHDNARALMPIPSVARRPTSDEQDPELPPCIDATVIPPLGSRRTFPLGIDEDSNWLSEFHCFVRAELIEVFQASHEEVNARNSSIVYKQIGLRCRHCAHRTGNSKAGRSSAFPSSIRQIYQSFTMMLRDHFPNCDAIQGEVGKQYILLKDKPSQGATDSKRYWVYSGLKIGMADSKEGIYMTKETRMAGLASLPFGVDPNTPWGDDSYANVSLVEPTDREDVSDFLYLLMSQVQPVRLTEAECIGNRRSLRVGLPGFACKFCCEHRRLGLCRMFPARRRTLPTKILDFYDHIRRCPLCPPSVKAALAAGKEQSDENFQQTTDQGQHRRFYDRVWTRLGHESSST